MFEFYSIWLKKVEKVEKGVKNILYFDFGTMKCFDLGFDWYVSSQSKIKKHFVGGTH